VKKIYLILLIPLLIGCESYSFSSNKSVSVDCPDILFASEHKIYFDSYESDINLENIAYKAMINNAEFLKGCSKLGDNFSTNLSILFIVSPIENNQVEISLPFYLAFLDKKNNLYEMNYYSLSDYFTQDTQTKKLNERVINHTFNININNLRENSTIIIGFMLDKKRLELID